MKVNKRNFSQAFGHQKSNVPEEELKIKIKEDGLVYPTDIFMEKWPLYEVIGNLSYFGLK